MHHFERAILQSDTQTSDGGINKLLTPSEAAEILGVAVQTLAEWRCTKRYPLRWVKVGKFVRYRIDDLLSFTEEYSHF